MLPGPDARSCRQSRGFTTVYFLLAFLRQAGFELSRPLLQLPGCTPHGGGGFGLTDCRAEGLAGGLDEGGPREPSEKARPRHPGTA